MSTYGEVMFERIAIIGIGIYPAILTDVVEAGVAPIAAIVEAVS